MFSKGQRHVNTQLEHAEKLSDRNLYKMLQEPWRWSYKLLRSTGDSMTKTVNVSVCRMEEVGPCPPGRSDNQVWRNVKQCCITQKKV